MNKVQIIAEAGVNHNGCITSALKMVDVAAECGADSIKFQTFKAENLVTPNASKADYQKASSSEAESQYAMLKRLELTYDDHQVLIEKCNKANIAFLSTPFDFESLDMLLTLGMDVIKIPSGEITNLPYLQKVGSCGKKVILSTGMSDMHEVLAALAILVAAGTTKEDITILHCTTEYPAPFAEVNLKALATLKKACGTKVGYSDHTTGIEVAIAAVALGATIIEKHFTLDKNMQGPDHRASLEPNELRAMVWAIRNIEQALGDGEKNPTVSELANKNVARKSIVAACAIQLNEQFTIKNLTTKRPGHGISPMRWNEILGKKAARQYSANELIEQ